ncbi:MAG: aldehyde dehydrogenase family protein [Gammaproteobacteria bacterium]|nr:aldehyde dehydrogenase family protein [Gammaproteobacteria bacterium]
MDKVQQTADEMLGKASIAAAVFQELDQQETDKIVECVFKAGFNNRVKLAKHAFEETNLGVWQHKVIKNVIATQFVYENIKNEKTVDVISEDRQTGITEIAQPLGPIFAIIPVTNPTSTVLNKILICLKTRNPMIISAHRNAVECCKETVRICYEAALGAGAPDDCIQIIEEHSRELTHAIMTHSQLALTLATGGTGLVHAAYSSGNPAIGVGPGNVPVFIDKSADIAFAVENLILSKTFDNGTICASEQSIVVEEGISEEVVNELEKQACYFLDKEEIKKLEPVAINMERGSMNANIVGKPANFIAQKAGIDVPANTKILIAPLDGIGKAWPLSGEVLAPILSFYVCKSYDDAIKTCIDLNYWGGIGHTASIYANDEKSISDFSKIMNAGRIVVNTPSSQGAVGGLYNTLATSFTLGCGSGGKNITTENISAHNLINIQRVTRRKLNQKWFGFDTEKLLDESENEETILSEYHKNS